MRLMHFLQLAALVLVSMVPVRVFASECDVRYACVAPEDMDSFLEALRDRQCLDKSAPVLDVSPITIVTDKDGRLYYSGSQPVPFKVEMHWCTYKITAEGQLNVIVAERPEKEWGWRFRLKFAGSFLVLDAVERSAQEAVDVGLLWDVFFWKDLNVNLATGFRSAGIAVGYDLTKNFGLFGGYGFSFWTLRSNPQAGLYFGFW